MFSNLSSSSISFATVTPSLVMRGAPNDLSSTTLRPFGPRVTFTALARMSTPRSMRSRASTENLTSLAAIYIAPLMSWIAGGGELRSLLAGGGRLFENAHDVAFLHDQEIDVVDLDLGARPLAEQDALADLEVDRNQFAGLVAAAWADSHDRSEEHTSEL